MKSTSRRRPSILDVARACNVAPSTVSNALSNKRYVHVKTLARILEAAEKLGYQASTVARSLRLQRSWSIGLLLANIANPFYPEVVHGVEEVAGEEGWNLFLCNTNHQDEKQSRYIEALVNRQVDGIILASHPTEQNVAYLRKTGIPCVLLNKGQGEINVDYVGIDHKGGIALACEHLMSLRHRRIAFIQGPPESDGANQRFEGYVDCLKKNGLPYRDSLCARGAYDFASGQAAARQLFANEEIPTAVIAASDTMALGAIDAILKAGYRVPNDISVIGFDDIPAASLPRIELTTIRVPKKEMGIAAAQILLARIKNENDGEPVQIISPVELIVRNTTAAKSN